MSIKFCPECGNKLDKEVDFCSYCGADLRERVALEKEEIPTAPKEITIATPEKTLEPKKEDLSQKQFADFLPRMGALVIDLMAILGISTVAFILLLRLGWIFILIIVPLISFFYFWILEIITDGQTLGKKALSLRTVNVNTLEPADPGDYFLNNLFKFTPITFIIDLILGFFVNIGDSKKRLRIMQNVSKTCVVRTK